MALIYPFQPILPTRDLVFRMNDQLHRIKDKGIDALTPGPTERNLYLLQILNP